ncbi:MAG: HAMP domain-containing protein [Chloroflexi bacterium]|nr:HAMP domain-containing protein [Chloroflexota bacterium]
MFGLTKPSLLKKHIVFILIALVVTLGSFGFWSLYALQESTQEVLRERLVIAEMAALHIDEHLSAAAQVIRDIASTSAISFSSSDLESQKAALREAQERYADSFTYGLALVDKTGRVVWTEPRKPGVIGSNVGTSSFFEEAMASPRPIFSGITTDLGLGRPGVLVAAPILGPTGTAEGLVVAGMDPARPTVAGLIGSTRLGHTGYAQVVDDVGLLVASTRPEDLPEVIDHGPRFTKLIKSGQKVVATCHRCHETDNGPERRQDILAFAPLSIAPWGVAIRQSEEEAFALVRDLQQKIIGLGIVSSLVLVYLAWTITKSVVTPIRMLTLASQRVAAGDFRGAIPSVGKDEIGSLASSLEAMRQRLNAAREEMAQQNLELQRKTTELQRKTGELGALFEASKVLTSTLDLEKLFAAIVRNIKDILSPVDAAALLLWDARSERLVPRSSFGFQFDLLSQVRLKPGEGIAGKVFHSGTALLLTGPEMLLTREEMSPENSHFFDRARPGLGQARQVICVPLIAKGVTTGSLVAYNLHSLGSFFPTDVQALQALADQAAIVVENARLYEEVQQKEEQRRQLLDKVILAQEEERKRIARELHDEIGQALTALVMTLGSAEEGLPSEMAELKRRLGGIRDLTADTLQEIRRLMLDLRPTLLDDLGLIAALGWYAETHLARAHVEVLFESSGMKQRLPAQMETVLFRVVQEAINNIVKHSGAKTARIRMEWKDATISTVIEDDGRGFDVSLPRNGNDSGLGLGLLGMEERITLLGGSFRIESAPNQGTRLSLKIPVGRKGQ